MLMNESVKHKGKREEMGQSIKRKYVEKITRLLEETHTATGATKIEITSILDRFGMIECTVKVVIDD